VFSSPANNLQGKIGRLVATVLLCFSLAVPAHAYQDLKLPNLGDASTSLFSAEYEYQLGRAWLQIFRGQLPLANDPLLSATLRTWSSGSSITAS